MDDDRPLFQQIVEMLEDQIIDGSLTEESRVPSTNELASFHRINPATAGKGLNQLVADGIVYKKRGIGMFVTAGARDALRFRRRERFAEQFVQPLIAEAKTLGITTEELKKLIDTREDQQ